MDLDLSILKTEGDKNVERNTFNLLTAQQDEINSLFGEFSVAIEDFKVIAQETDTDTEISIEGIGSFARSIASKLIGVNKTFAALVTNRKRSELTEFYDSNSLSLKKLESMSTAPYLTVKVDIPTGMTGKYTDAISSIITTQHTVSINTVLQNAQALIDSILSSSSKGSNGHEQLVSEQLKQIATQHKQIEKVRKSVNKAFVVKGVSLETKKFGSVIESLEELKGLRLNLAKNSNFVTSNGVHTRTIDNMSASMDLVVQLIESVKSSGAVESDYVPSKKFINELSTYLNMVVLSLDTYSDLVIKQMAVEHNIVMVYTKLLSV